MPEVLCTHSLTRRFGDGKVHLGCAIRWSDALQPVLQRLLDGISNRLFDAHVSWELL